MLSLPLVMMILLLTLSCAEKKSSITGAADVPKENIAQNHLEESVVPAWPVFAFLKTGVNPLWFEFGPGGPELINSPDDSTLTSFLPWPHAKYIAGIQIWNEFLVMAVNRDGFLIFGGGKENGDVVMYRAADAGLWDNYTVESFFIWDAKLAALLYRNDFFIEPLVPRLKPQVFVLSDSYARPLGTSVPALESFPPGDAWESEIIHRGNDGYWYYRMKEKGKIQNETSFFRTSDLAEAGTKISISEWRNSSKPENQENAPFLIKEIMKNTAFHPGMVYAVSPDFEGLRFYAPSLPESSRPEQSNPSPFYAYCRVKDHLALAVKSNGEGFILRGEERGIQPFSLPSLPEGFAYTGIACLGNVLAASWEEQQEAGIGAAGFMVMKIAN
jgi:hypothetical protein